LDARSAAKVSTALQRMRLGNLSSVKRIGSIGEYRIDWGPGYRIYLGIDGANLIILLGGGTKQRQSNDIGTAQALWADYLRRKAGESRSRR
jgi:putative addiction module killer protein